MVKVGCWNRRGSAAPSIWRVNGDLESWSSAPLMALCPAHGIVPQALWRWAFAFAPLVTFLLVRESLAWGGSGPLPVVIIIFVVEWCVWARGDCLRCARHSFLFRSFISRYMACSSSCLWDMLLPTREWLLLVCVVFMLLSRNLQFSSFWPYSGFGKLPCYWDMVGSG